MTPFETFAIVPFWLLGVAVFVNWLAKLAMQIPTLPWEKEDEA